MTLCIDSQGGGWVQCDYCLEPNGIEPPPSTWKAAVDTISNYDGPLISCARKRCSAWKSSKDRWVGIRAVVNNPEKYGFEV